MSQVNKWCDDVLHPLLDRIEKIELPVTLMALADPERGPMGEQIGELESLAMLRGMNPDELGVAEIATEDEIRSASEPRRGIESFKILEDLGMPLVTLRKRKGK